MVLIESFLTNHKVLIKHIIILYIIKWERLFFKNKRFNEAIDEYDKSIASKNGNFFYIDSLNQLIENDPNSL